MAAWKEHFPWLIVEQVSLFVDLSLLESWPGRVTHVSTSMTIELAAAYAEFNVLVSDPIRGMIARTVGLSIGERLTVYREREEFEARLIEVLEAQREPMPHPLV
ncbi:hypothetical protein PPSIR1_16995 [Plesiocystis pacifica SIR-1]|uniref:Uncharacterized protein n=1 Tax=Plesiocystis pacifica SIR-1 TaxID=391625 RepID=A6GGJ2_9BACT|nr:hypothetical protein [Plesiocystis pacifica]EDM75018.1 hypothetical protein PPSIR1_16995 [Plesiocystis pacifica SIR-1]